VIQPADHAGILQLAQTPGQHGVGDGSDQTLEFVVVQRLMLGNVPEDGDAPLPPDNIHRIYDGADLFAVIIALTGGGCLFHDASMVVVKKQKCAYL